MIKRIFVFVTVVTLMLALAAATEAGIKTWSQMPGFNALDVSHIASPDPSSSLVLAATDGGLLYRSANRGGGWAMVHETTTTGSYAGIAFAPNYAGSGKVLAITADDLLQSTNFGQGFSRINSPADTTVTLNNHSVAYSPGYAADNTIFVGTNDGLYFSPNGGTNWTRIALTAGMTVNAISVAPNYSTNKYVFIGTEWGFYRVQNLSTPKCTPLLDAILYVSHLSPDVLYGASHQMVAATDIGLVLISGAQGTPSYTNLSDGYFPADANGAPTFEEMTVGALTAYRTPNAASGWDALVGTGTGVYKLTRIGTTARKAELLAGDIASQAANSLFGWKLDNNSQLLMAGTSNGLLSYTDDRSAPSAWIGNLPTVTTDVTDTKKFRFNWGGSDSLSPVVSYNVEYRPGGTSSWRQWLTTAATSAVFTGSEAGSYYMRVRSIDAAGNASAWAASQTPVSVPYNDNQKRLVASGSWSNKRGLVGRYMQTVRQTKARGSKLTLQNFLAKKMWLIVSMGPKNGKADIYFNGRKSKTIDTYSATTKHRQRILLGSWSAESKRTLEIVNKATRGRPKLVIDGIAVWRK